MKLQRSVHLREASLLVALLGVSLVLRGRLAYRTASVDEALFLVNGWRWLSGQAFSDTTWLPGWYPLSFLPLGWAGWWGGITLARGLSALFGILTVALVYWIGRRVHGPLAGYLAGFLMAVSGPAIAVQTLATNTAASVFLFAVAVFLWITGLLEDRGDHLVWGSAVAVLSILMRFSAYYTTVTCFVFAVLAGLAGSTRLGGFRSGFVWVHVHKPRLRQVALFALPFAFLPLFSWVYGANSSLSKFLGLKLEGIPAATPQALFSDIAGYLWLPALLGLPAILSARNRGISLGLAVVGLGALPYHLLTRDSTTLHQNVAYMTIGLAPLAGGGLASVARTLQRLSSERLALALTLPLAAVAVLSFGWAGQQDLGPLRSYWSDVSAAMQHLQRNVAEGDVLLMEGGQVAEYYLVEKGTPGRIPARVWTTWHYQDEEGSGTEAFERAVRDRRFDWIILDYNYTPELDQQIFGLMSGRYELEGTFPALLYGEFGRVEVFRALP